MVCHLVLLLMCLKEQKEDTILIRIEGCGPDHNINLKAVGLVNLIIYNTKCGIIPMKRLKVNDMVYVHIR